MSGATERAGAPGFTLDPDEAADVLGRTPGVLRALLAGLPERLQRADEGEGTWSPFDVLGHLIHGERTDWIPRLRVILEHGESRAFEPFDRFAMLGANRGRTLAELLDEFEALRVANLVELGRARSAGLDPAAVGRHPDFGRVTAGELLATWVVHDLGHIAQIARVTAKAFGGEVGPWRAYLPVLADRDIR